tara:strand:+ start:269 stop:589 length:321 start_codon:yes stop_codon:yes gene_type:complete
MNYYCTAFDERVSVIPKVAAWEIIYQKVFKGTPDKQIKEEGLFENSECCSEFARTLGKARIRAKELLKDPRTNRTGILIRKHKAALGEDGLSVDWTWTGNEEEVTQ